MRMPTILCVLFAISGTVAFYILAVMASKEERRNSAELYRMATMRFSGPADITRMVYYEPGPPTVVTVTVERVETQTVIQTVYRATESGDNFPIFKTPEPYTNFFDWLRDQTNAWPIEQEIVP